MQYPKRTVKKSRVIPMTPDSGRVTPMTVDEGRVIPMTVDQGYEFPKQWIIKNNDDDYWSNDDGWTEFQDCATIFTEEERNLYQHLPLGGKWVTISEAPDLP